MNGQSSQNEIEQAEETYRSHVETRRRLGTMLAEAIKRDGGLPEFRRHMEDLPFLIRSADVRRTELKVELLGRQLKEAKKERRGATEEARRAGVALEEARRAYARAVNVEQRSRLEAQRLEELHREELGHLERLRSETAERQEEKEGDGTPRAAEEERARRAQDPGTRPAQGRWLGGSARGQ